MPYYINKSASSKGSVRIAHNKQEWRGFNLLAGHMFGEFSQPLTWYRNSFDATKGEVRLKTVSRYWVTGLEINKKHGGSQRVRIYLCEETSDYYRWHSYWVRPDSKLLEPMYAAVSERLAMGFDRVQTTPLEKQRCNIPTQLTTPDYLYRGTPSHNTGTLKENYWNCTLTQVPGHKGTQEAYWAGMQVNTHKHNAQCVTKARKAERFAQQQARKGA